MTIRLAYSPCPNDTYMLGAVATGKLPFEHGAFDIELHDVETLNRMAQRAEVDITKLSFHAWLTVKDSYRLLKTGAALGFGSGPLLIARESMSQIDVERAVIAVPGELTTAHILLSLWAPAAVHKVFTTYDKIVEMVARGEADCGVIIHESRFTYQNQRLRCLVDLGDWWEQKTGLPIPLGGFAVRSCFSDVFVNDFEELMRRSIRWAEQNPESVFPYMQEHAQQLEKDIISRHVDMFVGEYSYNLGDTGTRALAVLEELARAANIVPRGVS